MSLFTRKGNREGSWRLYQKELKRRDGRKRLLSRMPKYGSLLLVLALVAYGMANRPDSSARQSASAASPLRSRTAETAHPTFDRESVQSILDSARLVNLHSNTFALEADGERMYVETHIDPSLQNHLLKRIDRTHAEDVGIVAMDPDTGRILAMASYNKEHPTANPCIDALFPAASVFKIVTAAAGIETYRYRPDSSFSYNGRKHTLYKSQLRNRYNRYTREISFKDSFAQSVNPVFGKIGKSLGRKVLHQYAVAFGFNHPLGFELPVVESAVSVTDDPYRLAEIASGFNRQTSISPIHGAIIAATIVNRGVSVEPRLISRIEDGFSKPVYFDRPEPGSRVISAEASEILKDLMAETVRSGTGRKMFSNIRKHAVLSQLNIGGKTGSISNRSHSKRYDWFVGFAKEKDGPESLVLSIVVAHGKYIGTKAGDYARAAIEHYFGNHFAGIKAQTAETKS